jgi:hypothetical protein
LTLRARNRDYDDGFGFWQTVGNLEIEKSETFLIELFVKQTLSIEFIYVFLQFWKVLDGYDASLIPTFCQSEEQFLHARLCLFIACPGQHVYNQLGVIRRYSFNLSFMYLMKLSANMLTNFSHG